VDLSIVPVLVLGLVREAIQRKQHSRQVFAKLSTC